jgi:hypothetical protein
MAFELSDGYVATVLCYDDRRRFEKLDGELRKIIASLEVDQTLRLIPSEFHGIFSWNKCILLFYSVHNKSNTKIGLMAALSPQSRRPAPLQRLPRCPRRKGLVDVKCK